MNLANLFKNLRSDKTETEVVTVNVGTVEEPLELSLADGTPTALLDRDSYIYHARRPVLTGANAQRSQADRWKVQRSTDFADKDAAFPVNARGQRRAAKASRARAQKRGQVAYTRQQLRRESEANTLANLIRQADGPLSQQSVRAANAIDDRVVAVVGPDATLEERAEVLKHFRGVAKTAPVPLVGSARVKAGRAAR